MLSQTMKPRQQDAAACAGSVPGASVWLRVLLARSNQCDTVPLHCPPPAVHNYKHIKVHKPLLHLTAP